jgi:hypothetical protein
LFNDVGERWLSGYFTLGCNPSGGSLGGGGFVGKAVVSCQNGGSVITVSISVFTSGERIGPTFTGAVVMWCRYI